MLRPVNKWDNDFVWFSYKDLIMWKFSLVVGNFIFLGGGYYLSISYVYVLNFFYY